MLVYFLMLSIIITSSIIVISARNPIHSILGLISVVLNLVCFLILLEAEFLALTFIAVYLGAVTVLFLFVVMMLNVKGMNYNKEIIYSYPIGLFLGLVLAYILCYVFIDAENNFLVNAFNVVYINWYNYITQTTDVALFGIHIYSVYVPALLIVGVILLVALIGAMVLTKNSNNLLNGKRSIRGLREEQVTRSAENAVFLVNNGVKKKKEEKVKTPININYSLIQLILKKGQFNKADKLINKLHLELIKRYSIDSFVFLNKSIDNIVPFFILNSKKIGKRTIISPFFLLSGYSRRIIGIKWIISSCLSKKGNFFNNFIEELNEAFNNKGAAKKKQSDLNSLVFANRSNLKYRW